MVSHCTPAAFASSAIPFRNDAACALHSFLKSANFLVKNIGSTVSTVTRAPTAFARDKPCATPLWASFEPSVGMRICRYMRVLLTRMHSAVGTGKRQMRRCAARAHSFLAVSIDSTAKADVNSPFPHVAKGQQRLYTLL